MLFRSSSRARELLPVYAVVLCSHSSHLDGNSLHMASQDTPNPTRSGGLGYKIIRYPPPPGVFLSVEQASGNAVWTLDCCKLALETLKEHVAAAGDGLKFKPAHLSATVEVLNRCIIQGGLKTAKGLKAKIAEVYSMSSSLFFILTCH